MPRLDEDRPRTNPPATPLWRRIAAVAALAVVAIAVLATQYLSGQPRQVTEADEERIACISYAPFHKPGETPLDPTARVDPDRIRDDLQRLSARTSCVRTYSVAQGLDAVPAIAQELGMQVLLGAWLGRIEAENVAELDRAIALANRHPGAVRALIVGNEVMLRRELPAQALAAHMERARREAEVPVTYADVWEFWLRHEELAEHADFLTIHILPYWEDDPVEVGVAVDHVIEIAQEVQAHFDRPILIGESGWPSRGRQREGAVPSLVNQAEFVRRFVSAADAAALDYNLIEAFDQPWKRTLEGAMGGYWGVLDAQAEPKFPWRGPVVENVDATHGLIAAALGAILGLAVALATRLGPAGGIGVALLLAPAATMLVRQWDYMLAWNRNPLEWAISGAWMLVGVMLCLLAAPRLGQRLDGRAMPHLPAAARGFAPGVRDRFVVIGRLLVLAGACAMAIMLVFDARYRGFPLPLYLMPGVALALLAWLGDRPPSSAAEERVLALLLGAASLVVAVAEGISNVEAMTYCALSLLIALACWPRPDQWRPAARSH
jgi:glucan 1,3-beta-glucosidase